MHLIIDTDIEYCVKGGDKMQRSRSLISSDKYFSDEETLSENENRYNTENKNDIENEFENESQMQRHVHEFLGSTQIAEIRTDPHNHRFAGVSGQAIPIPGGNHVHQIRTRTDFYEDHFHKIIDVTGPAIRVGDRHVHFVDGNTTINEGHSHEYRFATLIDDPIGD